MTRLHHAALPSVLIAVAAAALAWPGTAAPRTNGCTVNIKFHSTMPAEAGKNSVMVMLGFNFSQVKIKNGFWKSLGSELIQLDPGETKQRTFDLAFGCGVKRRYKIKISGKGTNPNQKTIYYPGPQGWTERQSFKLDLHVIS